jgi:hypothetical protein
MDTVDVLLREQPFLLPAPVKFDKDRHLPPQDAGFERLDDVIDGSERISLAHSRSVCVASVGKSETPAE